MEKIGVITLFGTYNYGNRLQNYAVHQLLMKEGFQPETILWQKRRGKEWLKSIRCVFGAIARRPKYIRELRFRKFDKETIRRKTYFCKNEILPDSISQKYAFFVVGSDQVWNPEVRKDQKSNFFLRFCKREQRIALCPSYALDSMPTGCETEYKIGLQGFPFLSCREKNGAEILSLLLNNSPILR